MAESKPAKVTITKIEGARRQLEVAVALWFQDADIVAIHTLVAAGHHVCHDIITKRLKTESPFLFSSSMFPGEEMKAHKKIMFELEAFLKHADRDNDPETKITFSPEMTDFYLLDALLLLHMITGVRNLSFEAFSLRFVLFRKSIFESAFKVLGEPHIIEMKQLSRPEFLARYLKNNV